MRIARSVFESQGRHREEQETSYAVRLTAYEKPSINTIQKYENAKHIVFAGLAISEAGRTCRTHRKSYVAIVFTPTESENLEERVEDRLKEGGEEGSSGGK